jgi:transposase InsO family protein
MARKKRRKPKAARHRTIARKRAKQLKEAQARKRRMRFARRRQMILAAKRRKKAVKYLSALKRAGCMERQAAQKVAEKFQTSLSSIRRWEKLYRERGFQALMDEERRPHTIHFEISLEVKLLAVVIRTLLGWGERRISAELERRDIAKISHTSVNKIFHQYFLPTKTYHPKGKSDGLKRRRYQRQVANELWHLDFKGPLTLLNGRKVWLLVVIDDFSRFCLGIHVCASACADTVIAALQADFTQYGKPQEILTDNALAFTSAWQDSVGKLDAFLDSEEVDHKLISAYYPESNGKAEAFIKIVSTECLTMREFANQQELMTFVAQFKTYYNQYRAHGSIGYKPPVWRYTGTCPKVKGLGGLWGLETVAQQWSGESSAEAPIVVMKEKLTCCKALVRIS